MNKKFRPMAAATTTHGSMPVPQLEVTPRSSSDDRGFDALAEQFFSQGSLYPCEIESEPERTLRDAPLAMRVTLLMLAVSSVTALAVFAYMRLIMPVPADLGSDTDLPPLQLPNAESSHEGHSHNASEAVRADTEVARAATSGSESTVSKAASAQPASQPTSPSALPDERVAPLPAAEAATAQSVVQHQPLASVPPPVAADRGASESPVRPAAVPLARSATAATKASADRRGRDLVAQAFTRLHQGDARTALNLAHEATVVAPGRADTWIALGSAYAALNDSVRARDALRRCQQHALRNVAAQCLKLARE